MLVEKLTMALEERNAVSEDIEVDKPAPSVVPENKGDPLFDPSSDDGLCSHQGEDSDSDMFRKKIFNRESHRGRSRSRSPRDRSRRRSPPQERQRTFPTKETYRRSTSVAPPSLKRLRIDETPTRDPPAKRCLFCRESHRSENCRQYPSREDRVEFFQSTRGRICWRCLRAKKECEKKPCHTRCDSCKDSHNVVFCPDKCT